MHSADLLVLLSSQRQDDHKEVLPVLDHSQPLSYASNYTA